MMNKVSNLSDLLISNIKKMYYSEEQQHVALKNIKKRASSARLKNAISLYEKQKEKNISRLKDCFTELNVAARPNKCEVADTLISQCEENVSHSVESHVSDASLISTFQQLNHLNIANYGTAASFARTLNNENVARLLHDSLQDEKSADSDLSELAEETINPSAVLTI